MAYDQDSLEEVYHRLKHVRANAKLPAYLETELAQAIRQIAILGKLCICGSDNKVHSQNCTVGVVR